MTNVNDYNDTTTQDVLNDAENYIITAALLLLLSLIGLISAISMIVNDNAYNLMLITCLFSGVFAGAAWIVNHNAGVLLKEYDSYEKANKTVLPDDVTIDDTTNEDKTDYSEQMMD